MNSYNDDSDSKKKYQIKHEVIPNSNNPRVKIIFSDLSSLCFDLTILEDINPSFIFTEYSILSTSSIIEIKMPDYVTSTCLLDFIELVRNGIENYSNNNNEPVNKMCHLLQLSEFFEHNDFSVEFIQEIILSMMTAEHSVDFLLISYKKLSYSKKYYKECDQCWFELFLHSLDILGKNFIYIIQNIELLMKLDHKILEELMHKCFASLFIHHYILVENSVNDSIMSHEFNGDNYFDNVNNENNPSINKNDKHNSNTVNFISIGHLEKLIDILDSIRHCNKNFFDLLTNEYMNLCSSLSVNELNERKNPTFVLKIPVDLVNFYEEFTIDMKINNHKIGLIIFYKNNEDSFNVTMKLIEITKGKHKNTNHYHANESKFTFKILTFLSSASIEDDDNTQINVKSISNNKSSITIFKLSNFKQLIKQRTVRLNDNNSEQTDDSSFVTLKINLKVCYTHSVLASFLLKNFYKLFDNPKIAKIPKDFLVLILKNKHLCHQSEDEIVISMINWIKDEINIKEDINEIIDNIQWEKVSENLIFEFMIKYSHMIYNEETEQRIIKLIQMKYMSKKYNVEEVVKKLFINLFVATRKVDYPSIYTTMIKSEKLNMIYRSHNKNNQHSHDHDKDKDKDNVIIQKKESSSQETMEMAFTQANNDNSRSNLGSTSNLNINMSISPLKEEKPSPTFLRKNNHKCSKKSPVKNIIYCNTEANNDKSNNDISIHQDDLFRRIMKKGQKNSKAVKGSFKEIATFKSITHIKPKPISITIKSSKEDKSNNNKRHNSKSFFNLLHNNPHKESKFRIATPILVKHCNNTKSMAQLIPVKNILSKSNDKTKKNNIIKKRNQVEYKALYSLPTNYSNSYNTNATNKTISTNPKDVFNIFKISTPSSLMKKKK